MYKALDPTKLRVDDTVTFSADSDAVFTVVGIDTESGTVPSYQIRDSKGEVENYQFESGAPVFLIFPKGSADADR
ncbi:hypothetical protein HQO12_13440 [Rhodococcus fascians]|uniref:hypothetical protein n=1 Tax=Rhodococcoides fascians TaxID=1828 RepID=UPI0019569A1E|nr:hypothetical protein [Rhodococcus fascians]MBM7243447.1 hypothetical protein [Rhodococcus fascians]MBY3809906.1 hypothetical protein [Rhodococcus fascians]MBY3841409.1 hypothetical protein [Rhodococcus fascians]MBY3844922.1 hypothetical protein [Rhodococcus fascians]MBY3850615.1 hypothetical protein [Rhodococcus fascians]